MPHFDRLFPTAARPPEPRVPEFERAADDGASNTSAGDRSTAARFRSA